MRGGKGGDKGGGSHLTLGVTKLVINFFYGVHFSREPHYLYYPLEGPKRPPRSSQLVFWCPKQPSEAPIQSAIGAVMDGSDTNTKFILIQMHVHQCNQLYHNQKTYFPHLIILFIHKFIHSFIHSFYLKIVLSFEYSSFFHFISVSLLVFFFLLIFCHFSKFMKVQWLSQFSQILFCHEKPQNQGRANLAAGALLREIHFVFTGIAFLSSFCSNSSLDKS